MTDVINWLHLTDLHIGIADGDWLWPRVKHELFKDLEKVRPVDGWDLVFFTGDLTQGGTAEEFERLNIELRELWEILARKGATPRLCVVPGNHDLVRPPRGSAIMRTLSQLWWSDPELRSEFWRNPRCEYRVAVNEFFKNYTAWITNPVVPLLQQTIGILPGDFSATFQKGAATLGIVGLNSSFLHLGSGAKERLDLHVSQVVEVCDKDPTRWVSRHSAAILLSHHSPDWLAAQANDHFRQEIHPPGRFLVHMCGHQHEPTLVDIAEGGAAPRRLRQAPSLFGLESWGEHDGTRIKRIHGYNSGQYFFRAGHGEEKLWPRIAVNARAGGINLGPDNSFNLENDCCATRFGIGVPTTNIPSTEDVDFSSAQPSDHDQLDVLNGPRDEQEARKRLLLCPRLAPATTPHHNAVRQGEQAEVWSELRKGGAVWIKADWGLGASTFLSAALQKRAAEPASQIFHLRCEDASDVESLTSLFSQQFGLDLGSFCSAANSLQDATLLLDDLDMTLITPEVMPSFAKLIAAIRDYCVGLKIIIVSRVAPMVDFMPIVELRPLDVPDVRSYIMNHPDATPELYQPETIELIHNRSDGLPVHIDRILKALKVTSLPSLFEGEAVPGDLEARQSTQVSKALARTVAMLQNSSERRSQRSFLLLKVLSILSSGETLEVLKHYMPQQPFFDNNAIELSELALLDVFPLQQLGSGDAEMRHGQRISPKLLRVPRQVRDYVQTLISTGERKELIEFGVEHYIGRDWREGRVKMRKGPLQQKEYLGAIGPGNEFSLLLSLMDQFNQGGDIATLRKVAQSALQYARVLRQSDRYRELATVSEAFARALGNTERSNELRQLIMLQALGLRMTGRKDLAIELLEELLGADAEMLSREDRASAWLDVSLARKDVDNDAALEASRKVLEYAEPGSGFHFQATSIIAELGTKGSGKSLVEMEKQARNKGHDTVANNIALTLAERASSPIVKARLLDRVLSSNESGYNRIRAIISKVEALHAAGTQVRPAEEQLLVVAYSYCYMQRLLSMFDRCHDALWTIFERQGDNNSLLRLFRHTSFVWRIRGEDAKETRYLELLKARMDPVLPVKKNGFWVEIRYFSLRIRALLN